MSSGIYGVIEGIEGSDVYVRIGDKTKIRVQRSAIAALEGAADGSKT
jgi:preprotein translocase subunit YajC